LQVKKKALKPAHAANSKQPHKLNDLIFYFLWCGTIGFGVAVAPSVFNGKLLNNRTKNKLK
jgi:hypothetical protein